MGNFEAIFLSFSLTGLAELGLYALSTYLLLGAVRRVYFHPLTKFQGPKLFAVTNLVHIYYVLRGEWVRKVLELHETYGPVVRVAPNEISYISEHVWNDVYKASRGQEQMKKYMPWQPNTQHEGLFNDSSNEEHALIRKKLSPIFSDRGVREREAILLKHITFMVEQLKQCLKSSSTTVVDIIGWYQCVTTDVVGDVLTGKDFGTLANSKTHAMIEENSKALKGLAIGTAFSRNPILRNIFVRLLRPSPITPVFLLAKDRFDDHLAKKSTDGNSIVSLLATDMDTPSNISTYRAQRVTYDFLIAGTDTVAITLSGATYLLLQNPEKYVKVRDEIRSTFATAEDITLAGVNALKYQNAVILESLRLWPPGPETTRRIVMHGGKAVEGEYLPANTLVGVYHWAANRYSHAWNKPDSFIPERWLGSSSDDAKEFSDDKRGVMQPYNIGPRNCVGQNLANAELRLILAMILWHFDLELEDPADDTWMDVKIFGLLAEKRPLNVRLTERT